MRPRVELQVNIGEVKTARSPDLLKATLGSCVAIAFLWKEKGRYGMAHCLLPESPAPTHQLGAKYVDQAIPSLVHMLKLKPEDFPQVEVHLVGGANMMEQLARGSEKHVGIQNSETALRLLEKLGFTVKKTTVGGTRAQRIVVDCQTGEVETKAIERIE